MNNTSGTRRRWASDIAAPGRRQRAWLCGAACMVLLAACGAQKSPPATQVAAKVNQGEISVHQINFVLQQQRGLRPEQADAAGRRVLERLIDQELAVQQAAKAEIDRDPRVLQALEAARREVLARAWLERQSEGVAAPTAQDVEKYFNDKPALFKNRRIYTVQEFSILAPEPALATLQNTLQHARSAQAFADALAAAKLRFESATATRPAENIPLDLLDKLAPLSEGQGVLLPAPGGARAIVLLRVQAAPVGLEQARSAIEQYLLNDARRKKAEADMKALRATAAIEYTGNFAQAPAASQPEGAAREQAPAAAGALDADAISKGLKLK